MCEKCDKLIEEEIERNIEAAVWISFADESGFKGAVIVKAFGPAHAYKLANDLGINPGGYPKMAVADPDSFKEEDFNKLLTKDYLLEAGYIEEKPRVLH